MNGQWNLRLEEEAFENCSQPVVTLERLVRFQDSCAVELLRVSFV